MKTADVLARRQRVLELAQNGLTPTQIAACMGCSRVTVYAALEHGAQDLRLANAGRGRHVGSDVDATVAREREDRPYEGPAMLHARMTRDPEAFGLTPETVPSRATLARRIQALGLARKPVGPRDARTFPDETPTSPGLLTVDTWGPWAIRAQNLYLVTIQDRFTRFLAAYPAAGRYTGADASSLPGVGGTTWAAAILLGAAKLARPVRKVYSDNGVGMVPAGTTLMLGVRVALRMGAEVVFIPPGQPWRNGRLERVHWTMETEYWRHRRPSSLAVALAGLRDWLNWYNLDRPHRGFKYTSPAEANSGAPTYEGDGWYETDVPASLLPQVGTVSAIRLVFNDGTADCWGHRIELPGVLAGQFVRITFRVTGEVATGDVYWEQRKGQPILVATFVHRLDAVGKWAPATSLFLETTHHEFAERPSNELVDEERLANQWSRVTKRRSSRDRKLAREAESAGGSRPGGAVGP